MPKLTEYLREAAEELAPESTVAEENKKIYDSQFGWKAIRLMANRSNRFFDYKKDPLSKTEFLKMMILKVLDAERVRYFNIILISMQCRCIVRMLFRIPLK